MLHGVGYFVIKSSHTIFSLRESPFADSRVKLACTTDRSEFNSQLEAVSVICKTLYAADEMDLR